MKTIPSSFYASPSNLLGVTTRSLAMGVSLLGLSVVTQACMSEHGGPVVATSYDERTTDRVSQGLSSRIVTQGFYGDEDCTPFEVAMQDRTFTIASAVLNSPGFQECVRESINAYHVSCPSDPWWSSSLDQQATKVLEALRRGNHTVVHCNPVSTYGHSQPQPEGANDAVAWAHTGSKWINLAEGMSLPYWESQWPLWSVQPGGPWQWQAGGPLHELAHAFGYDHTGTADCGYPSAREPSIPYIMSDCTYDILYQSGDECTEGLFDGCASDEIRLLSSWNTADRDFSGTCACVPAARHRAHFGAPSGANFLAALNGGGSTVNAASSSAGPWETFYLVDLNGGYLEHDDVVYLRTWLADPETGWFVGAVSGFGSQPSTYFNGNSMAQWRIRRAVGAGRVRNGDAIGLFNVGKNRFLTAAGGGGSTLTVEQTTLGAFETFTYLEPSRAVLANLRTSAASYVRHRAGLSANLTEESLLPEYDEAGFAQREAREQAFWIIDHNGGVLQHNDIVSFESSVAPEHWSTCSSGAGPVRGNATFSSQSCQRFRIERDAGPGAVQHQDAIRIFSLGQSRYLELSVGRLLPTSISGNTTGARFRLDFAQGRDSTRARF